MLETLIDTEDIERLETYGYSWYSVWKPELNSYYVRSSKYKGQHPNGNSKFEMVYLHRFIMNASEGEYVDHINHNILDNRKSNLRIIPQDKNTKHRSGKNSNNKSGYRNVCWNKTYNKWVVQLQIDGKNTILDKFDDVHEAGKFAEDMRKKHYGKFAGKS